MELFLDSYGGKLRPGWVFPVNHETALHMGMVPMNGKVVGEFICDRIDEFDVFQNGSIQNWNLIGLEKSCVEYDQIAAYVGAGKTGRAWHISDLVIYDTPKSLADFGLDRAPQSWGYVYDLAGE